jgi:chromosome partitioning protein
MKGGVGKSTLAFNLVWWLAYRENLKVLAVDLDPQANLSQYLMGASAYKTFLTSGNSSVVDIFERFSGPSVQRSAPKALDATKLIRDVRSWDDGSRIDLIPSRLELSWTLKNPTDKSHLLAKYLADHASDYDVVVTDCGPTESVLTTAAYRASRFIVVPVRPEFLSTIGLPLLARSVEEFKMSWGNHALDIAGVVVNGGSVRSVEGRAAMADLKALCATEGWHLFEERVPHSDSFPNGARSSSPIFQTAYARGNVIGAFEGVAEEFANRIGLGS